MAKNKTMGLLFRMENFDGGADAEVLEPTEALAAEAEANSAVDEVQSASGDVTEVATGIENAQEAQAELDDVTDTLREAVESGEGLTEREAVHVNARMERIATLLGASASDMGLSLRREHFGGKNSRLAATKLKLENAEGWGNKIWDVLKKGWQWLGDTVNALVAKTLNTRAAQEKNLKNLKGRLEALEASEPKKTEVNYSAKMFSVNGKVDKETVTGILKNTEQYSDILNSILNISNDVVSGVASGVDPSKEIDSKNDGFVKALTPSGAFTASAGEGTGLCIGRGLVLSVKKEKAKAAEDVEVISLESTPVGEKVATYQAFTKEDLGQIVDLAIASNQALANYGKVKGLIEKTVQNNIRYCEEAAKNSADQFKKDTSGAKGDEKKAAGAVLKSNKALTKEVISGFSSAIKDVTNELMSSHVAVIGAAATLVAGGLGNLKAPGAAPAEGGGEGA